MGKLNRKASAIMEYAIVLGVVSLALNGMSVYLKRGIQAKAKDLTTSLIVKDLYLRHQEALASGCDSSTDPHCLKGAHQYVSSQAASEAHIAFSGQDDQAAAGNTTSNDIVETTTRAADFHSVPSGWEDYLSK